MKIIQATKVFQDVKAEYDSKQFRGIILEGGSGSSKSISLSQLMGNILVEERDALITVTRKTMPSLRATAMADTLNYLKQIKLYRPEWHNKQTNTFTNKYTNSAIEFLSVDDPIKVRSRRRTYLWMNEANEFELEDYRQMAMRTKKQIFMDYNPSYQFHWIYDELQGKPNWTTLSSSYKDNPFLPDEIVKEIEGYKDKDPNYWNIYGLGLKGFTDIVIYSHWKYIDSLPENYDDSFYGLDFGFNNQTALVEVAEKDKDYFWDEKIYQTHLTNKDLIDKMIEIGIDKKKIIYADAAEPARIKEIKDAGFTIVPAIKDVTDGIDEVKKHAFYITKSSLNIVKEVKAYAWKTKDGKPTDEPVKVKDHLMDAGRYAVLTSVKGARGGMYGYMRETIKKPDIVPSVNEPEKKYFISKPDINNTDDMKM